MGAKEKEREGRGGGERGGAEEGETRRRGCGEEERKGWRGRVVWRRINESHPIFVWTDRRYQYQILMI